MVDLALAVGREPGMVARTLRLALLSPEIVGRIIAGQIPPNVTLAKLRDSLPDVWEEQFAQIIGK